MKTVKMLVKCYLVRFDGSYTLLWSQYKLRYYPKSILGVSELSWTFELAKQTQDGTSGVHVQENHPRGPTVSTPLELHIQKCINIIVATCTCITCLLKTFRIGATTSSPIQNSLVQWKL